MTTPSQPRLGRYEVLEEIGKGAMGVVYLARDPLIGRLVALKTFRVGFAAKDEEMAQFRSRFVREAQSAGILSHPNIVTIHDVVDEGAQGVCFIAMEYVKGTNLKQLLQRPEPFTPAFVVEVVSQIAEALDYAHSRGVVHRDIKPANILITVDNKVKITDFGIARLDTSNLTMEGQLLGTPNYMAPEQIQAKDVDHRADIFSLGVVFYELLTRRKPFQGENLTQVTHKIVYEPFTPPEEIVKDLPPGLSLVLTRCLQKDPNRRYPRAAEIAKELRAVLERQESFDETAGTQEVEPPAPSADEPATRKLDRRELAAAAAAAAPAAAAPPAAAPPAADPDAVPTRRLERAEMLAQAAAATARHEVSPLPRAAPAPAAVPQSEAPPPAPAPPAPRATTPVAPAPAAPSARPPARRGGLWLAAAVGGAVIAVVVIAALAFTGETPQPPAPAVALAPAPSTEQQNRITAATALAEARSKFAQGDLPSALQAVAQAELAEPGNLEVRLLREAIENRTRELASEVERGHQVAEGLVAGRQAAAASRWSEAVAAARAVLALEPDQPEARKLLADAQRELKREQDRAAAARLAAAAPAAPEPAPTAPPPPPPAAPVAHDAALDVQFVSAASEGVLTIYAGERQIVREPFRFIRKSGRFSRERVGGTIAAQRRLATGPVTLRVYVVMPGKPTKAVVLDGEIEAGRSYQLAIRVDADGRVGAELR